MSESSKQYSKQNTQDPKHIRGGEKKVMKKSLSAILAASMAFSMFASAAFAAEDTKTTEQKFQEMKTAGIFQGYPDGKSHLEETMTRAEFAKALAALLGLEDDAAAAKVYSDVAANHWAIGEIGALTAEEIMNGTGAGKFGPKVNVSIEQLAKIVVGAMGLEPKEDAEVEGKTSAWATGYVAAAVESGLITKVEDYTVLATRGNLVDASYTVYSKGQISVKSTKVVDAKNIEVTFSDDEVVKKELAEPLKVGVATKVEVEHKGAKYTVEVTLAELTAEAKAAGAKKIEVKFNQAVDTAKAKFEVKRGSSAVTVSKATFSDDKMTATLELDSKIVVGDYTVTVKEVSETALTSTFKGEAEKLTALEFVGEKLAVTDNTYSQASISYKITNQYKEDVTKQYGGSVTWTPSKGTVKSNVNGKLTIGFNANDNIKYVVGEQVSIAGIHSSGLTVSQVLSVGSEAMVETVTVKELYHPEKKGLTTSSNYSEFVLLIEAKDQYGNIMNAKDVNDDVLFMANNPAIFNIAQGSAKDDQGANKDTVGIPLVNPVGNMRLDGTNTITFISKAFTKTTKFDVEVTKGATLHNFTLENPSSVAANDGTIRIPFSATDANGGTITKYDDLNGKVSLSSSAGTFVMKKDFATGNAYLEWSVPAQGRYTLTAVPNTSFQPSTIFIDVQATAVPTTVEGVKDFDVNIMFTGANQTFDITKDNIVVKDQYQRNVDLNAAFFANYEVELVNVDSSADFNGYGKITSATGAGSKITLTANAAASDKIAIKLINTSGAQDVTVSTREITVSTVAQSNLSNYSVNDIGKIYYENLADVKVVAKNIYGDTVTIPATAYNISAVAPLTVNGGKLDATAFTFNQNEDTKKAKFTVTFNDGTVAPITKELEVTNVAPVAKTVEFKSAAGYAGDNYVITAPTTIDSIDDLLNAVTIKDQYGKVITNPAVNAQISTVNKVQGSNLAFQVGGNNATFGAASAINVTGATAGDTFNVQFIVGGEFQFTVQVKVQ
ncbi:S-layer homology domain-containing protein [Paenibacillus spongiae]|uniref:S-layer homology domain-containing protein n=1 Tax=Paenibacillus spongiae TaxID=2909671 RepID=A0ABY5S7L8_9BACL|nr:S-layer homology domain-containing protein [Paenibacillus spongiae]UVI29916.1 S-layer homology domain-containing protein [Paenibacillus spongiae]